jgi:hypothetical protein
MSSDEWPEVQSTKLDAARRQLETAVSLLFLRGDAVSTHTLAYAAFGIIKDVATHRGERTVLSRAEDLSAAGKKGEFWKGFNRAANFFKHADRDPDAALVGMAEEENEALISIALAIYRDLGCVETTELLAFRLWWAFINFESVDDLQEPFVSWLVANHPRLHADTRHELLELGEELLDLARAHRFPEMGNGNA